LYEVKKLMLEARLLLHHLDNFPTLAQLLATVRLAVSLCEDSIIYMKRWAALQGWSLDFEQAEEGRRRMLPEDHPCKLIQLFVREVPIAGEGSKGN
jgi:hypothetical protein